jgi:hypothetical protein
MKLQNKERKAMLNSHYDRITDPVLTVDDYKKRLSSFFQPFLVTTALKKLMPPNFTVSSAINEYENGDFGLLKNKAEETNRQEIPIYD